MIGWQAEQARRAHRVQQQADRVIELAFYGLVGFLLLAAFGLVWLVSTW